MPVYRNNFETVEQPQWKVLLSSRAASSSGCVQRNTMPRRPTPRAGWGVVTGVRKKQIIVTPAPTSPTPTMPYLRPTRPAVTASASGAPCSPARPHTRHFSRRLALSSAPTAAVFKPYARRQALFPAPIRGPLPESCCQTPINR